MGSSSKRSWKLQDFAAHDSNVNCLALGHQTGRVLVTGGKDAKVNLWAVGKTKSIMSLSGHATEIRSVRFGNTDEVVCAGSAGGIIKVWDLNAAKLIRTLPGHQSAITCSDFHPYGDLLVSGSTDRSIKVWDVRRKGCILTYDGHESTVNCLKFSPDGQWIASAGDEGAVKLWDIRAGRLLKQFSEHCLPVKCIQFHPHEFLLSSGGLDGVVNFYDLENFTIVSRTEQNLGSISSMAFSKNGECLYVGTNDGMKVFAWEPARLLDVENTKWGQVKDMALTDNQMIGASHVLKNVSVFILNLLAFPPATGIGESSRLETSLEAKQSLGNVPSGPFGYGQSVRKSFSKERPKGLRPVASIKTIDESERSGTDPEEEHCTDIPSTKDYMDIFQPQRSLNRTPPPIDSPNTDDVVRDYVAEKYLANTPTQMTSLNSLELDMHSRAMEPQQRSISITSDAITISSDSDSPTLTSTPSSPKCKPVLMRQHSSKDSSNKQSSNSLEEHIYQPTGLIHSTSELALNRPLSKLSSKSSQNLIPNARNYFKDNNVTKYQSSTSINNISYTQSTTTNLPGKSSSKTISKPSYKKKQHTPPSTPNPSVRSINESVTLTGECNNQIIPTATDRAVGLDLDEFLPKSHVTQNMSEQEVLNQLMGGHDKIMAVLNGRQRNLNVLYAQWQNRDMKAALDYLQNMQDRTPVLVDLLRMFLVRPSMWDLDMCVALLPQIHELIQSKYESYVTTGCEALRLILQNFSSVIRNNVSAPVGSFGVDIPREERYAKCMKCHDSLLNTRAFLLKRQTLQGKLGTAFRELQTMMDRLDT